MIFDWLFFAIMMYIYASLGAYFDYTQYGIHLPGTVPSYHYYFYLKMVEWVFFGFGFVFLTKWLVNAIATFLTKKKYQFAAIYPAIVFSFFLIGHCHCNVSFLPKKTGVCFYEKFVIGKGRG